MKSRLCIVIYLFSITCSLASDQYHGILEKYSGQRVLAVFTADWDHTGDLLIELVNDKKIQRVLDEYHLKLFHGNFSADPQLFQVVREFGRYGPNFVVVFSEDHDPIYVSPYTVFARRSDGGFEPDIQRFERLLRGVFEEPSATQK